MSLILNACNKLNKTHIDEFKKDLSEDTEVTILLDAHDCVMTYTIKTLKDFFTNPEAEDLITDDKEQINFVADDRVLTIQGSDFKWHIAVVRNKKYARLSRLFDEVSVKQTKSKEKKETNTSKLIKVAICTIDDFCIENISIFEGTKQQCIAFINKEYAIREIRNRFDDSTRISFNYQNENTEWKTLETLEQEGVIEL